MPCVYCPWHGIVCLSSQLCSKNFYYAMHSMQSQRLHHLFTEQS